MEGRAALHHRLDVNPQLVLAHALRRHDAQAHPAVGLRQPDQLHLGLLLPLLLAAAIGLLESKQLNEINSHAYQLVLPSSAIKKGQRWISIGNRW